MPTILITGANRGIGLELCKQYLKSDWKVHAACRDPNNAMRLSVLADTHPELLTVHALDIRQAEQISALKTQLANTPIDILFNNAGIYAGESAKFGHSNTEVWLDAFNVNVIAPMKMIEAFADNVANSNKKIIANMSSKMGSISDNGSGGSYAYRSSKSALNSTMMSAAHDLKESGIAVLLLHPGWVRTKMGGPNGELSTEESANNLRMIVANASIKDSGSFFDIDGSIIPW